MWTLLKSKKRLWIFKTGLKTMPIYMTHESWHIKCTLKFLLISWISVHISMLWVCRATHKGWDFIDDCTEFKLSVSLYPWYPATVNLGLSLTNLLISHFNPVTTESFFYSFFCENSKSIALMLMLFIFFFTFLTNTCP